ncbi:citrate lyase subunit gamma [Synergistales bacterium]|nr:citrate lyase subunit gamma [Synergistales bacterium]
MIIRKAQAGSLESSDCLVTVEPADAYSVSYSGQNEAIFKRRTERLALEIATRLSARARISIQDQGALDVTLRARIETAIERASGDEGVRA